MANTAKHFSLKESASIFGGRVISYISNLFDKGLLFDHSIMKTAARTGQFRELPSIDNKMQFGFEGSTLLARKRTSDSAVFKQVFLEKEYAPLVHLLAGEQVNTIIDAGANVGYASVFFHQHFPQAKIFSIEPSVSNRELLTDIVKLNKLEDQITVLPYGVWSENKKLQMADGFRDDKEWSFKVTQSSGGEIEGRTLANILQEHSISRIDILKVDIEGAEKELFESPGIDRILRTTKAIAIETHEEIGIDRLSFITASLIAAGFSIFTIRECTFGINKQLRHA